MLREGGTPAILDGGVRSLSGPDLETPTHFRPKYSFFTVLTNDILSPPPALQAETAKLMLEVLS